ncbi:hypothetical protein [Nocardiopsis ansamitocini]|uniref:Uncharacterized protein n=1 Tax=Nocardiopsis ansamitocini TaxID=1670832 RepID=A0A9W6UGL0_9ACTN|nr:hypothetical protein [Nocardiopsis ansamitocini]GLU45662.1 hypothetical protein Nans01_00130 [Nocardiopsis ansamitocini]
MAIALPLSALPAVAGHATGHPDGPFAFGDSAVIAFPFGAYPAEYDWDDMRDVAFTVDGVQRTATGEVRYELLITTPELGRVFGVSALAPQCFADGAASDQPTPLPGTTELEEGAHLYELQCAVPEGADVLEVRFTQRDAEGDDLSIVFAGVPAGA